MKKGFTLVEVSATIALLAVCALVFTQLVALTVSERTVERTRRTAVDQMLNVMELLAVVDPERLAAGNFDKTPYETLIERSVPDGKIVFDTKTIESGNVVFTITVSWSDGEKRPRKEVAMFRFLTLLPFL